LWFVRWKDVSLNTIEIVIDPLIGAHY
jgi:hypothetical protein